MTNDPTNEPQQSKQPKGYGLPYKGDSPWMLLSVFIGGALLWGGWHYLTKGISYWRLLAYGLPIVVALAGIVMLVGWMQRRGKP